MPFRGIVGLSMQQFVRRALQARCLRPVPINGFAIALALFVGCRGRGQFFV